MLVDEVESLSETSENLFSCCLKTWKKILQHVGPGLSMAGATIGISHLIQAPRAGAQFGFNLLLLVLIINILKYPFYEFGHRYFAATNQNLLTGYKRLGKSYLLIFFILNIISAFTAITALTFITAGALENVFQTNIDIIMLMGVVYILCLLMLIFGKARTLRRIVKSLLVVLIIFTLCAFLKVVMPLGTNL